MMNKIYIRLVEYRGDSVYYSEIASNLKDKIDKEISSLINDSKMVPLEQHIFNLKSKEELEKMKLELLLNNEKKSEKSKEKQKQKILVLKRENGFISTITLSLIVVFVLGIAIGIGYMLYRFGV